jgi:hypothetical protein
MALVIPDDFSDWIGKDIDTARQDELVRCASAAQAWVARQAGLRSLEKEDTAVATYLEACDAHGEYLYLPNDVRPAWHTTGSDLMTVVDSGSSLSVSATYSTTASVILMNVNTFKRVALFRSGGWPKTLANNVVVTCKVGWHADTGVLIVPDDVKRLVIEVAWLMFNSFAWVGRQNVSKAGAAVSIENDLSPGSIDTLNRLRGV